MSDELLLVQAADRVDPVGQQAMSRTATSGSELLADGEHVEPGVGLADDLEAGNRVARQTHGATDDRVHVGDDQLSP